MVAAATEGLDVVVAVSSGQVDFGGGVGRVTIVLSDDDGPLDSVVRYVGFAIRHLLLSGFVIRQESIMQ